MENRIHADFKVSDRSYLAILKKEIHSMALVAGISEKRVAEVDIVVAELASNLVKHADHGVILAKPVVYGGAGGIEIIGVDQGPGMTDVNRMIQDGISTKNTLGQGLGSIKRLSDVFQIYSQKEWGTISLIRLFNEKPQEKRSPVFQIRDIVVAKQGETECGDGVFYKKEDKFIKVFLGDGLGHGHDAAVAVKAAGNAFLICEDKDPVEIIRYINASVKKTRGLVGTVAVFDLENSVWRVCGVGNITSKFIGPTFSKTHISYNGIIGLNLPNTLNSLEVKYEKDQYFTMCSDGIKSRWDVRNPTIFRYDPSVLASAIFKDFNRHTDDMSIAVCKINK